MTAKPRLLIFASGSPSGGGSGFENLVQQSRAGILDAEIAGVVSNHPEGGVREKAERFKIPFRHFPAPWTAPRYQDLATDLSADFVALSGWLKLVTGLDPKTTVNIHPAPLPNFGGPGMYGLRLHEQVLQAHRAGKLAQSEINLHFVTEQYDRGPIFFRAPVPIHDDDTPSLLAERVKEHEQYFQPRLLNLVVQGKIRWDGRSSLPCLGADDITPRR